MRIEYEIGLFLFLLIGVYCMINIEIFIIGLLVYQELRNFENLYPELSLLL